MTRSLGSARTAFVVLASLAAQSSPAVDGGQARRVGTIVEYDQLERDDVPHYRMSVLNAATLEVLREEDSDLNVTVLPMQTAPGSSDFIATSWGSGSTHRQRHYRVDAEHAFRRVSEGPAPAEETGAGYSVSTEGVSSRQCQLTRGTKPILTFACGGLVTGVRPFHHGQSLYFTAGPMFVVPDVGSPRLVEVHGGRPSREVVSPDDQAVYATTVADKGRSTASGWAYREAIVRVDASGQVTTSEPTAERQPAEAYDAIAFSPSGDWLVASANHEVAFYDPQRLTLQRRLEVPVGRPVRGWARRGGTTVLVAGCAVIELGTWKTTSLEGCFPAGDVEVTDQAVFWVGKREQFNQGWTRLHRFDLEKRKETAVRDFDGPTKSMAGGFDIALRAVYLVSGGRLLVLSGTNAVFFDHDHL